MRGKCDRWPTHQAPAIRSAEAPFSATRLPTLGAFGRLTNLPDKDCLPKATQRCHSRLFLANPCIYIQRNRQKGDLGQDCAKLPAALSPKISQIVGDVMTPISAKNNPIPPRKNWPFSSATIAVSILKGTKINPSTKMPIMPNPMDKIPAVFPDCLSTTTIVGCPALFSVINVNFLIDFVLRLKRHLFI